MTELTITTASHLLIGLLGATGLILSAVSLWKANQFSDRLRGFSKGIIWSALAVIGVCAIVLYANSLETVRVFEIISYRVATVIRGL
jgi:predicted membrane protein